MRSMKYQQIKQWRTIQWTWTYNDIKVTRSKLPLVWWATIKLDGNAWGHWLQTLGSRQCRLQFLRRLMRQAPFYSCFRSHQELNVSGDQSLALSSCAKNGTYVTWCPLVIKVAWRRRRIFGVPTPDRKEKLKELLRTYSWEEGPNICRLSCLPLEHHSNNNNNNKISLQDTINPGKDRIWK